MTTVSVLDKLYRKILLNKFFSKGWGSVESMRRVLEFTHVLSKRDSCMQLVDADHPVTITKREISGDCEIIDGQFQSPFALHHPNIMPKVAETAKFQLVVPIKWTSKHKPVCIHLAGTGDHGFWRRRALMARPLVKEAQIGSILLENPFYGCRKPKEQLRSSLLNVTDLFVMGGALVLESIVLLHWCQRMGFGPLGITGISMGGHMASAAACGWDQPISLIPLLSWSTASISFTQMASLAASSWSQPLSFVPCLSWSTASMVWTQGVLSGAVSWDELEAQYSKHIKHHKEELSSLISSPEQHRWEKYFEMGQNFALNYPDSIDNIQASSQEGNRSFYTSLVNTIVSKRKDPFILQHQEKLKLLELHSPNLPTKPISIEVLHFMRGVMDQCTHLSHFDPPVDPSLIIIVTAMQDGYMPRDRVTSLTDIWPGSEIRYIDQGHVAAFLFKQNEFRKAIIDSFERQIKKYHSEESDTCDRSSDSSVTSDKHTDSEVSQRNMTH